MNTKHSLPRSLMITIPTLVAIAAMPLFSLATPIVLAQESSAPTASPVAVEESTLQSISTTELTAIPPQLEIKAKPGEVSQQTIRVRNATSTTQYINTTTEDFIVGTDGKTPIPVGENIENRFSLAKWITVSPTKFALAPNQTQVLTVLIQVPENAAPGGRYAMILHERSNGPSLTTDQSTSLHSASSVSMKVGTLVYLTIEGNVKEEAYVRNLQAPSLVEYGPVPVSFEIENLSDIHIRPQTSVQVTDMLGRSMGTIKVDENNIFPNTQRAFQVSYPEYWGFGKYTAKVTSAYGTTGKVAQAVISFWIIPYTLIAGVVIGLSALFAIAISVRRHLMHRNDVKTQEIELLKKRVEELETEKKA